MKAARAAAAASATTVEFTVNFGEKPRPDRSREAAARTPTPNPVAVEAPPAAVPTLAAPLPPPDVPAATKRLVVAYYFERLIELGAVENYAEIAKLTGLSRARITQICRLAWLDGSQQSSLLSPASTKPPEQY